MVQEDNRALGELRQVGGDLTLIALEFEMVRAERVDHDDDEIQRPFIGAADREEDDHSDRHEMSREFPIVSASLSSHGHK